MRAVSRAQPLERPARLRRRGDARVRRVGGSSLVLSLALLLAACYLPSAARRAGGIVRSGWDTEARGAWVIATGPGSLVLAVPDLVVHAFIPLHPQRREPVAKWFKSYPGRMLPSEQVAILCHHERSTNVDAIREQSAATATRARHERWHFPQCLEVLPGVYELEVHYFSRGSSGDRTELRTTQAESTEPSTVEWVAEAGGFYLLTAMLGRPSAASGPAPRSRVARSQSLGTQSFRLEESEWNVEIHRLSGWDQAEERFRSARAEWERYERMRH